MRIPVLNGIYTDETSNFRTSYPRNLIPVPKANGISEGYLKPADGIVEFNSGVNRQYADAITNLNALAAHNGKLNKLIYGYTNSVDSSLDAFQVTFDGSLFDINYLGVVTGKVVGATPASAYRVDLYASTNVDILQGSSVVTGGVWSVNVTGTGTKYAKLIRISDSAVMAEGWTQSGLCRSYLIPKTDTLYTALKDRCFMYDQAIILISACCINDYVTARYLALSFIATIARTGTNVIVSVNARNGMAYNTYVRTETTAWVLYALSFYKKIFPTSDINVVVNIEIDTVATQLMTYYIVAAGQQQFSFTGGYGKYSEDYSTFDPSYTITASLANDNIVAYFALKLAGTIRSNATYTATANAVANSLVTNFWDSTNNRFHQSVPVSGTDITDSLMCHTLGSLFLRDYLGEVDKTQASYSEIDLYKTTDSINGIVGYQNYLTTRGYPGISNAVSGECTLTVGLARSGKAQNEQAVFDMLPILATLNDSGIPYSILRDSTFAFKTWYGAASIAWVMIATSPNGLFGVSGALPTSVINSKIYPGIDRGGINWNGYLYRVMGSKLCALDNYGNLTILGDVGGSTSQVTMDYSFDRLAIASEGSLYYWNGKLLQKVTDPDLRTVLDFVWIDGYFLTTDGTYIVVTELNNPLSVSVLKYGSSEVDPDNINKVLKYRDQLHVLNRYTTEVFQNVGGSLFPFERVNGAMIPIGAIGTYTACLYNDYIAILGSGRKQPPSIYVAVGGQYTKIATREIDTILQTYGELRLSKAVLEERVDRGHDFLYVHLDDQTLVYDAESSKVMQTPIWFTFTSGDNSLGTYRARNLVWVYDKWICGDVTQNKLGYLTDNVSTHYGEDSSWEFSTQILYNEGAGAIFHNLELVVLSGRYDITKNPVVSTSYSNDGIAWSKDRPIKAVRSGNTNGKLVWLQQGSMRHRRMQKFKGTSSSHISVAALLATVEPLAN
jgi:hypothetical protein